MPASTTVSPAVGTPQPKSLAPLPHLVLSPGCEPLDLAERHLVGRDTQEWLLTPRQCPTLGRHGIFLAGWSEARSGFYFSRPRSAMSQLLFCTGGAGEVLVGGGWCACRAGQVYLTPPSVTHAYRALTDGKAWSVCWITYHTGIVALPAPHLMSGDVQLMSLIIRHLRAEAMGKHDPATLQHWVCLLQTYVERQIEAARAEVGSVCQEALGSVALQERLVRLWEQVALHPAQLWDIARLAAFVGVSGEHLRRLCQRDVGCSPMQQVTRIRITHAAHLLTQGQTLAEIAEQVGYSSPFVLSNVFYRLAGVRPSEYASKSRQAGFNQDGAVQGSGEF